MKFPLIKALKRSGTEVTEPFLHKHLKHLAHKIACTDGAVNKLKDYAVRGNKHLERGPDYIIGDFDSLKKESLKWLDDQVCIYKILNLNYLSLHVVRGRVLQDLPFQRSKYN